MTTQELTQEQKTEMRDGTISSLEEWGPRLLPGLSDAFRQVDGINQVRASFFGEASEGFRPIQKADFVRIRTMIEAESIKRFGLKFRVDRVTVAEYVEVHASDNATPPNWLGVLPEWDEVPRLKRFGEIFGVESTIQSGCSPSENARICELAGRAMFMHPCFHAQGIASPVPVVVFVNCAPPDLRRLMAPVVRGPMREVIATVATEQKFAEALDPCASHVLLPGMPQVADASFSMDVSRFATVARQSSVRYRPPYATDAVTVNLPMMVASIPSENWRAVARGGIPIIPLSVRSDDDPDPDTVAQCYAEAMLYATQGHPIVRRGLESVRTVWNGKKEARA